MASKTVKSTACDLCKLPILSGDKHLSVKDVDICYDCLEKEYHRICLNEVPTRRGGYRELGVYDG